MDDMKKNSYVDEARLIESMKRSGHRAVIGGLWDELGELQFNFLVANGLTPLSKLIDVGCGCLRGGVHFIDYLESGNYFGIDRSAELLEKGYSVELEQAGLTEKLPRENLICNDEFDLGAIAEPADFAIAQSLFSHLPGDDIVLCLKRLAPKIKSGGRFFATFFAAPESHPHSQPLDHPGGIRTFSSRDPYHYRVADIVSLCEGLPWEVIYRGTWNHPRDQHMLEFIRTADAAGDAPSIDDPVRILDDDAAKRLPAGANHYRAYVGPPDRYDFMGATQFALLFALGLRDFHRVLDFGCGSLRLGRLLIPFLRTGGYFGIDPNEWLISDAFERELGSSIRAIKQPRFRSNADFRCDVFDTDFDFIVAQSIITHCGAAATRKLIAEAARVLRPEGKFIFSIIESSERHAIPAEEGWIYPRCVEYGAATLEAICGEVGLLCHRLRGTIMVPFSSWREGRPHKFRACTRCRS